MKTETKMTDRMIRAMPYEVRLRNYEREKDKLFSSIAHMSAAEVSERHQELARKWQV